MGLDPRGFMDGAFRGFQMMESHYDRQDRKQDRTDSLRRADEINTENQRRYDAQIARQDERQTVDDQRYTENRTRDDKNQAEEKAWRKQVHNDNKALQGLRYATSGRGGNSNNGSSKEYRGAVTKLMDWKHDAIAKIDPSFVGKERELAIESINSQYDARLTDVNSLYVTPEPTPTPKNGGNGGGTGAPPPNSQQSYLSWINNDPRKSGFISALKAQDIDVTAISADKLTQLFEDNESKKAARLKNENKFNEDASFIRSMAAKVAATASSVEPPKPVSLRSATEVMDQAAMQNYSNALAGNTRPQFSAPVLNAGVVDGIEAGADLAVKTSKQIAADTALYVREQNKKALESAGKNSTATPYQTYY